MLIINMKINIKKIKAYLKKFFSKLFSEKRTNYYIQPCIDAAQCKGYIETVSNKADSLHKYLKEIYEKDLENAYKVIYILLAPYFRQSKIRLGIDFHEKGYYGKHTSIHIMGTNYGGKSYKYAFEYISISLLTGKKDERIHLFALPVYVGDDRVSLIKQLIDFVKPFFNKIEVIQFDRGFYIKELIYWLEDVNLPYLIHLPKCEGKISDFVSNTKNFSKNSYTAKFYSKQSGYWMKTNIYVCKNICFHNWLFASNINFKNKWNLFFLYKNRWQIETNYSISNQNRIMSKSTNYIIRYFHFLVDILLQILWRLFSCVTTFKQYLLVLVFGIKQVLKRIPRLGIPPDRRAIKWFSFS